MYTLYDLIMFDLTFSEDRIETLVTCLMTVFTDPSLA